MEEDFESSEGVTLSRAESALLSEIMSEADDSERVHHSHVERALTRIRQQINAVNNELARMTVSMLEILTRLDHWLKERFKVWLDQMKQYQVETTTRFITTSALILSQLKRVTTGLEEVKARTTHIEAIEKNVNAMIARNAQRDDNMRSWMSQYFARIEAKQDIILSQIASFDQRMLSIESDNSKHLSTMNGVETEIRTLLAREDITARLAKKNDETASDDSLDY